MSNRAHSTIARNARRMAPGAVALAVVLGVASPAAAGPRQGSRAASERAVQGGSHGTTSSDPDGMSNGGVDAPGGTGGTDQTDQDHNNGCGNDADREDDNNGKCGGAPAKKSRVTPSAKPAKPAHPAKPAEPAKVTHPTRVTHTGSPAVPDATVAHLGTSGPSLLATETIVAPAVLTPAPAASPMVQSVVTLPVLADQKATARIPTRVLGVTLSRPISASADAVLSSAHTAGPAASSGMLPRTGGNPLELSLLGLGLLGLGATITRSTRSTRSTASSR